MKSFLHGGDYGDLIYVLPCLKLVAEQDGEPCILYAKDGLRDHDPFIPKLPGIRRLVNSQRYVKDFLPWSGQPVAYDTSRFRDHGYPFATTLAELQARSVGLKPDLTQRWLREEPSLETKGRIVIARSGRYGNPYFPWKELVGTYRDRMVFVGHFHEYARFCADFGSVLYAPTNDLYDVACLIAGCAQFIGNQSSPYAIAEGLKHPSIQETNLESPDCIFPRPNARHCFDGGLDLNLFGRALHTKPVDLRPRATTNETPPGGWKVTIDGRSAQGYSFDMVVREIRIKLADKVPDNLLEMIIEQSSASMPPSRPEASIRKLRELLP